MAMLVFNGHVDFNSYDGVSFFAPGQARKDLIFQETALVADTRVKVVLRMSFLTLNSADIRFAELLI